jgi:hypothetical protein
MAKWDEFIAAVESGAKVLAKDIFNGFEDQASEDARAFARKTENDLKRWTEQLALKQIDKEDFIDFIQAKQAVMDMQALTQVGIAQIKLEKFRKGLIDLVINNACKLLS